MKLGGICMHPTFGSFWLIFRVSGILLDVSGSISADSGSILAVSGIEMAQIFPDQSKIALLARYGSIWSISLPFQVKQLPFQVDQLPVRRTGCQNSVRPAKNRETAGRAEAGDG